MTAPVSQVLSEAADLLEKPGAWGQGGYQTRKGCFCVLGAISMVSVGKERADWGNPSAELTETAAKTIAPTLAALIDWNDDPERTQPEVVDALRRAAALAKEQGR